MQIAIQSRKLDIRPYIALLEERYREQVGDLLKIQTREYIEFIKSFTENANIMTKSFFMVVPYTPPTVTAADVGSFFSRRGKKTAEETSSQFEEHRTQLEQRIAIIEQGLIRTGVRVVQLGTEEIIELYYKIFNPGEQEKPIKLS